MAANDGFDKLVEKFIEISDKISAPTLDAALKATQYNGINEVLGGLALICVCAIVVFVGIPRVMKWGYDENSYGDPTAALIISLVVGVFVVFFVLIGCSKAFNVWTWVAIFDPQTALVRSIMKL